MPQLNVWTRDELVSLLGAPSREGNGAERVEVEEKDGKKAVHIYSRAVRPNDEIPPPIEGVDRWLMWDCFKFESESENYRKFLKEFMDGDFAKLEKREDAESVAGALKGYFDLQAMLHCVAHTRLSVGGKADEWILMQTCPKHRDMQHR